MEKTFFSKRFALSIIVVTSFGCAADPAGIRYRGGYTLGHEVNTFCPEINSECYWLSSETTAQARHQLKTIYQQKTTGLYQPVCVIIQGEIDKTSQRMGFARDMDGLVTISHVYGDCDTSRTVSHGDLQHHRWVLIKRDNQPTKIDDWPVPPVLDFGEKLFVEGGNGCRSFNGFAKLVGDKLVFDQLEFGDVQCDTGDAAFGLYSIGGAWKVRIEASQQLILESTSSTLTFKQDDWR
ncbi:MAG: META domain-containing protein [Gammaproteobacteria bacterium]|nr:META domain-containing protein [Gammaproteobacteria bacterium]